MCCSRILRAVIKITHQKSCLCASACRSKGRQPKKQPSLIKGQGSIGNLFPSLGEEILLLSYGEETLYVALPFDLRGMILLFEWLAQPPPAPGVTVVTVMMT